MKTLPGAVAQILEAQKRTKKPLAIVLAGHNGSGKSTMWRERLSETLQVPLINADRMMMSILPEPERNRNIPAWARRLRDSNRDWMSVAQRGVQAFVGYAMGSKVPFAMETVFSHWVENPDGTVSSKIDLIREMQAAGYFVLLLFVGLTSADLSVLRVQSRVIEGGHGVAEPTLRQRFPRTQKAVGTALRVADAAILTDNSRDEKQAFTVCRVQLVDEVLYDVRETSSAVNELISVWIDVVAPRGAG